jgi:hypothetical protein
MVYKGPKIVHVQELFCHVCSTQNWACHFAQVWKRTPWKLLSKTTQNLKQSNEAMSKTTPIGGADYHLG